MDRMININGIKGLFKLVNSVEKNYILMLKKSERILSMIMGTMNPFLNRNWIEWVATYLTQFVVLRIFVMFFGDFVEGKSFRELSKISWHNPLPWVTLFMMISPGIARFIVRRLCTKEKC